VEKSVREKGMGEKQTEGTEEWYGWLQVNGRPGGNFSHNSVAWLREAGMTG